MKMDFGQKIKDLKSAAANAVNTFLGSNRAGDPRVRVAVVPYADAVNTGDLVRYVHNETGFTTGEPPVFDPIQYVGTGDETKVPRRPVLQDQFSPQLLLHGHRRPVIHSPVMKIFVAGVHHPSALAFCRYTRAPCHCNKQQGYLAAVSMSVSQYIFGYVFNC